MYNLTNPKNECKIIISNDLENLIFSLFGNSENDVSLPISGGGIGKKYICKVQKDVYYRISILRKIEVNVNMTSSAKKFDKNAKKICEILCKYTLVFV